MIMKKLLFAIVFSLIAVFSFSQKLDSTALILIDIQDFYFPGGAVELHEPEKAGEQAKQVLKYFRANGGLVVHVAHEVKVGGAIHKLVAPIEGEKVISKTEVSCFNGTDMNEYLQANNIKNVVLVGMQTHMCLEGATRAAYDLGYSCTVIHNACATRDLKFGESTVKAADVHASTLATLKSYAKVIALEAFLNP